MESLIELIVYGVRTNPIITISTVIGFVVLGAYLMAKDDLYRGW